MSILTHPTDARPGFLSRQRIIAGPGYNRWLVPPAALAIHLSIGQVYAFSVFNRPLEHLLGGATPAPGDWKPIEISLVFSIAIVVLGLSAALFGRWLERAGPRQGMLAAAVCFGGGLLVAAAGVWAHQIWLLYLGYGVLGGVGLGVGYISPVSTLIKWFPDRPGMATGLAIMGFGGGAMIGSPLATALMRQVGVAETFAVMGVIYLAFMLFGAATVRLPAPGWLPAGYAAAHPRPGTWGMTANEAITTRQFWLLWAVLFLNVSAGIAVLKQASPMIQDTFPARVSEAAAGGFVGLLSLFNMAGRFGWSSLSDAIGRKTTYAVFFSLGAALYALTPETGQAGSVALFVLAYGLILTMYGGGFATIPAYLRDVFGVREVGAIHGRLLTAWSAAGVVGPTLITQMSEYQQAHAAGGAGAYTTTMYVLAGLLAIGFICNLLVHRIPGISPDRELGPKGSDVSTAGKPTADAGERLPAETSVLTLGLDLALRWLWVGIPLAWGVSQTVLSSFALFR